MSFDLKNTIMQIMDLLYDSNVEFKMEDSIKIELAVTEI